ncbi:hypothetical protein Tsubulata_027093 [Turnera subulata]|uniref:TIR domain-containing protein n=1 Tax=Turnera subulata TaxID=218843 RepID=A0A9Q0F2Z5_9ROSI|nr:hypothetical protein Tsubulata_027093 [Turnera subulata]
MPEKGQAAALTPPATLRLHWDVFISFRGEDTRHRITKNLYSSLTGRGVRAFLDDAGMTQGDEISPTLMEAIEESSASIIILSPNYANSHWCLEELARICELRRLILPVFYQVEPSNVRRQKGPFENDFKDHLNKFGEEKVGKWREAMFKVGGISGFVFGGGRDSDDEQHLIQLLAKRVLSELRKTPVGLTTFPVGLDARIEKLKTLLAVNSNRIQVLGIYGMGGIGKTTLVTALYNEVIGHYEHRSFIPNVRETCKQDDGMITLQKRLLSDLFPRQVSSVIDVEAGISEIKRMVYEKRVLVVLDDVDDVAQLNALAGKRGWYGEASRIIITTRDKDVLSKDLVNESYEVRELDAPEALQLFSYHALRREKPPDDYIKLSKEIVSLTGGLPLALEVFGSFLYDGRGIGKWEDALKKLREIRPRNLQDVLKISFDGLDDEEKCVFLDISCLFVTSGMKRKEAIDIFKGCGFRAETTITVLAARCLIKVREDRYLWMHDQLKDMGRQIVYHESLTDPGMRSRLWESKEILTVLEQKKGTRNMEGIILEFKKKHYVEDQGTSRNNLGAIPNFCSALAYLFGKCLTLSQHVPMEEGEMVLRTEGFKSMANLRLLQINQAKVEGKFRDFPGSLKWLQWKGCPLNNLPSDYSPSQLAVLDLSESGVERVWDWGRNKVAGNLMVMNLRGCYNLVAIPDLSGCKNLEKLDLELCSRLTQIHNSVGNMRSLLHLNLKRCSNLAELPADVSGLKSLEKLALSECSKLKELPDDIGNMSSLRKLLLDRTPISKLPDSIFRLTKLEKLSLNGCKSLTQLPHCLGNLVSLKTLSLNDSALEELPNSVGCLSQLEKLSLMWCKSLTAIPESVGNLRSLTEISLNRSAITELPASIGSLSYLKGLFVGGCHSLSKLPDSTGGLASISELELDETPIEDLPDQIEGLKMIEKLNMRKCTSLVYLPEAIGRMLTLTTINLFGTANIMELPESIGMLESLVILRLTKCTMLHRLPSSIGNLKSLKQLLMEKTSVTELPESFGMLSSLMILKMRKDPSKCLHHTDQKVVLLPTSFSNLSSLEELDARAWGICGKIPDDFQHLSSLRILDLAHNKFSSLPSSLEGLSFLRKLCLLRCKELKFLPPLPSSLEELDISDCFCLEVVSDLSNLGSLKQLNLTNCQKVIDVPGIECLKSLTRLFMSNCGACSSEVTRRLSKVCLRNIRNLSIPGSKIPDWFSPEVDNFSSEFKNSKIRAVLVGVVVSFGHQIPDIAVDELPVVPDIRARILKQNTPIFTTALHLLGIPNTHEEQIHLCRYPHDHPFVLLLKDGCKIEVTKANPPIIEGVELKKWGIHLVYEGDDDYEGNEGSLVESQQSVSERLASFFNSIGEGDGD